MSKIWLVLDCNNICHRNYHAIKSLFHNGVSTGVLFGFFRDLFHYQKDHTTSGTIFCFDHGKGLRMLDHPEYKSNRRVRTEAEQQERSELNDQIDCLRCEYLPGIGYKNVWFQEGYEADDIIAGFCQNNLADEDHALIISSDRDLYQLLAPNVSIWNGRKMIRLDAFEKEWGLRPSQWVDVKAMAGCTSDFIKGISSIGEMRAAKYLRGELSKKSVAYRQIVAGKRVWMENIDLVQLPYPGLQSFTVQEDELSPKQWKKFCDRFGMKSMRNLLPAQRQKMLWE